MAAKGGGRIKPRPGIPGQWRILWTDHNDRSQEATTDRTSDSQYLHSSCQPTYTTSWVPMC
jgi:hypothetical protein